MGVLDNDAILRGLSLYLCFIPLLTFHEFAHAWTAWKCGDSTAKDLGRISLNPIVHMELIGTVLLPLAAIFLSLAGSGLANFIIGWGKPVPVDSNNLRNPRRDDTLIAMAGPAMNLALAVICMAAVKIGLEMKVGGSQQAGSILLESGVMLVQTNLLLAFFNLLPIPPLDGSHFLWNAARLSWELFYRVAQYGFIIVIVALNLPGDPIGRYLDAMIGGGFDLLGALYRI